MCYINLIQEALVILKKVNLSGIKIYQEEEKNDEIEIVE